MRVGSVAADSGGLLATVPGERVGAGTGEGATLLFRILFESRWPSRQGNAAGNFKRLRAFGSSAASNSFFTTSAAYAACFTLLQQPHREPANKLQEAQKKKDDNQRHPAWFWASLAFLSQKG